MLQSVSKFACQLPANGLNLSESLLILVNVDSIPLGYLFRS